MLNFHHVDDVLHATLTERNLFDAAFRYPTCTVWILCALFHASQQSKLAHVPSQLVGWTCDNPRGRSLKLASPPPLWVKTGQVNSNFSCRRPSFAGSVSRNDRTFRVLCTLIMPLSLPVVRTACTPSRSKPPYSVVIRLVL